MASPQSTFTLLILVIEQTPSKELIKMANHLLVKLESRQLVQTLLLCLLDGGGGVGGPQRVVEQAGPAQYGIDEAARVLGVSARIQLAQGGLRGDTAHVGQQQLQRAGKRHKRESSTPIISTDITKGTRTDKRRANSKTWSLVELEARVVVAALEIRHVVAGGHHDGQKVQDGRKRVLGNVVLVVALQRPRGLEGRSVSLGDRAVEGSHFLEALRVCLREHAGEAAQLRELRDGGRQHLSRKDVPNPQSCHLIAMTDYY